MKLVSKLILAMREELAKEKRKTKFYKRKAQQVHRIIKLRPNHGFVDAIMPELALDEMRYHNNMRVTTSQFEQLLSIVGPLIQKQNVVQECLPPATRLSMTLRYVHSVILIYGNLS